MADIDLTPTTYSHGSRKSLAETIELLRRICSKGSEYNRLANLSDAQLNARGLSRQDLPREVFAEFLSS